MIAPAGTRSVVLERDILAFAQQEGLKIKEYPLRTSEEIEQDKKQNLSAKISHRIMRTVDFATLEQPLSVFGFAAIALLIETAALAVYSFQLWGITGQKPVSRIRIQWDFADCRDYSGNSRRAPILSESYPGKVRENYLQEKIPCMRFFIF